jgi:hypothetical protein
VKEPWRDTASPDWVLSWGHIEENDWLERELGLSRGRYRTESLQTRLSFKEPRRGEQKNLSLYDLVDQRSDAVRKVVIGEITNGIWAQGYWRGQS